MDIADTSDQAPQSQGDGDAPIEKAGTQGKFKKKRFSNKGKAKDADRGIANDAAGVQTPLAEESGDADATPFLSGREGSGGAQQEGNGAGIGKTVLDWPAAKTDDIDRASMPIEVKDISTKLSTISAQRLLQRKRRWFRPLSILVLAIIAFFVWFLATFPWLYMRMSGKEYSEDAFVLAVSACAVQVRRGSKREVIVEGQSSSLDVSYSSSLPLRALTVKNRKGCLHVPYFQCSKVCKVLVEVPDDAAPETLHIYQQAADRTPGLTVDVEDVTLNTVKIRGKGGNWWDFAGPTLGLSMKQVTVQGDLFASLIGGRVLVETCTLKSSVRLISQENSVYVLDTPVPDTSAVLPLKWRNVNQNAFLGVTKLGTQLPIIEADPGGDFEQCDSTFNAYKTNTYYDMNKDGFVDFGEFVETIGWKTYWNSLGMCCGSRCPFSSWCDGVGYQVFTLIDPTIDGGSYVDRATFLSTSSLWNRIKGKGGLGAMLVPGCHRLVNAGPSGATATAASWMLEASTDGEVRVLLRADAANHAGTALSAVAQDVESAYHDCYKVDSDEVACRQAQLTKLSETTSIWCPSDRTRGLRLLGIHARQLMTEVGKDFGDLLSTRDAVVIIDVRASPGVPGSRWIYSTRPVFLAINPAILFTLSAGLLVPELKHYSVAMLDTSCDLNFTNYVYESDGQIRYADQDWRLTEVYQQLYYGLHSNGLSIRDVEIRGNLVLLRSDGRKTKMYEFLQVSGGWEMVERRQSKLDQQMMSAIWLSLSLGAVWGLMGLVAIWEYLRWLLSFQAKEERMRERTLRVLGVGDECDQGDDEVEDMLPPHAGSIDDSAMSEMLQALSDNPLRHPIPLITTLVVDPIRRQSIDALQKFIVERCFIEKKMNKYVLKFLSSKSSTSSASEKDQNEFIYMREFRKRFEVFCTQQRLNTSSISTVDLRRYLILTCGCNLKTIRVRRLQGVQWKKEPGDGNVKITPETVNLEVMKEFFNTRIDVTGNNFKHFIDIEDHFGREGLYRKLLDFCQAYGREEFSREQLSPSNTAGALATVCEKLRVPYKEIRVTHVSGIKFVDAEYLRTNGLRVTYRWYLLQFVGVVSHVTLLLAPSALVLVYMMFAQSMYAQTVAMDKDVVSWMDILGKYPITKDISTMMAPVQFAVIYQLIFAIITVLYVLLYYLELPKCCFTKALEILYSFLLGVHLFAACMTIGIICAWFVVASLLDPTKFLPYGTAVIVLAVVVRTTYFELTLAAVFLKKQLRKAFDLRLRRALNRAQETIRAEKQDAMAQKVIKNAADMKGVRQRRPALNWDEPPEKLAPDEENEIKIASPAELWSLLETDEEGAVAPKEFRKLLERLDIGLTAVQMDQLFACCDLNDSGGITEMEMYESWEFFVTTIMESAAQGAGVGTTDIVFTVSLVCISLVLLFTFVFLALQGWYNESSFNSMVQAVIVSLTGKLVKSARKKVAAEGDPEAVNELVASLAAGAEGEAGGDGGGGG